ncbi:unnamed protein product [Somion occarium]|uniref:Uncharacterized protein n=1 Tax=Somion occarium TaxID=3059160 RepID=A0ABP1DC53_9APHY
MPVERSPKKRRSSQVNSSPTWLRPMSRPDFDVARRQSTRDAIETQSPEDEGRKTAAMRALGLPKASEVSLNTHPFDWPALEATLEELRYIKLSECSPEIQGDIYCIPSGISKKTTSCVVVDYMNAPGCDSITPGRSGYLYTNSKVFGGLAAAGQEIELCCRSGESAKFRYTGIYQIHATDVELSESGWKALRPQAHRQLLAMEGLGPGIPTSVPRLRLFILEFARHKKFMIDMLNDKQVQVKYPVGMTPSSPRKSQPSPSKKRP